ncbi:MAG: iron ABC transporter permease [Roseobacter sp.]
MTSLIKMTGERFSNWRAVSLSGAVIIITLIGGTLFSLATGGRSDVGLSDLFNPSEVARTVLWDIRAPRLAVAALLGCSLGLAGLSLQAVTRNSLASPSILGINQGAAFGLCVTLVWPDLFPISPGIMAMVGGLTAGALTLTIAGAFRGQINPMRLILGGVAVAAFSFAMVRFTYTLDDDLTRAVVRWTVGDISGVRWSDAKRLAWFIAPSFIATLMLAQQFNLMALGQGAAQGVGVDPRLTLLFGTLLAASLAGISVSVAGPIAFAGLVLPHLARMVVGTDYRQLVPTTAVLGAGIMLIADGLSKWVTAPSEAPIGVVVALIGAPWFLWYTLRASDF